MEICDAAIHLCRIRVTRLDALGNPMAGPNNVYVSDKPISLTVKPSIEAGQDKTLVGGCDCIIAEYRGYDKLKRFDLELMMGVIEPALVEMMTGAAVVIEGGQVAGLMWPNQLTCSSAKQPNVAIEGWQDAWNEDHQESAPIQYIHWIWPSSYWQIADFTLQNDFNQPRVTGFTRGNTNWGVGPYGDAPVTVGPLGGFWFTNLIPDAVCDYQTHSIT